jgi:hypothetical protein
MFTGLDSTRVVLPHSLHYLLLSCRSIKQYEDYMLVIIINFVVCFSSFSVQSDRTPTVVLRTISSLSTVNLRLLLHQFLYGSVLLQVTEALAQAGLESSNLIVGIDFTKSNEWTGSQMIFPFLL